MTYHVNSRGVAYRYRGGCSPGMRLCHLDCGHRDLVESYRLAAAAQAARVEAATGHHIDDDTPEVRAYLRKADTPTVHPSEERLTFKAFLLAVAAVNRGRDLARQEHAA